jgi:hypothetical protein
MAAFGLWVLGIAVWHAIHGTLPHALTMGAVGIVTLVKNRRFPSRFGSATSILRH